MVSKMHEVTFCTIPHYSITQFSTITGLVFGGQVKVQGLSERALEMRVLGGAALDKDALGSLRCSESF